MRELRNLSGIYFREKIGDKWENVCFEDLNEETQDRILAEKNPEFIKNLAKMLGKTLREIGDKFDIITPLYFIRMKEKNEWFVKMDIEKLKKRQIYVLSKIANFEREKFALEELLTKR